VLVLFALNLQSSFFSFRRDGVDLEGLSLRESKLDLRESLDGDLVVLGGDLGAVETLVRDLVVLGGNLGRRVDKSLKMRGLGVYF